MSGLLEIANEGLHFRLERDHGSRGNRLPRLALPLEPCSYSLHLRVVVLLEDERIGLSEVSIVPIINREQRCQVFSLLVQVVTTEGRVVTTLLPVLVLAGSRAETLQAFNWIDVV